MPEYFDRYINLVEDIDVVDALEKYGNNILEADKKQLIKLGDKVYAPGKWTVKDIIQHLIDVERIFSYRALRFARKDETALPGFDENYFASTAGGAGRSIDDLLEEFAAVRKATLCLYKSFNNEKLVCEGICYNRDISVLAIGFTMAGHIIHHHTILKERYYKLI